MPTRRLAVVAAGISQPSSTRLLADRLAAATVEGLAARGIETELSVLEARDHARDLVDHLLTGFPSPRLQAAIGTLVGADGTHRGVAHLQRLLQRAVQDVLRRPRGAMRSTDTPVLVGATGGTSRHSLALDHALRPLFAYLGAAVVPTGVFAATDDWGDPDAAAGLAERIERAGGQLAAAVARHERRDPADPFGDPVPFTRLLAGEE